MRKSVVWLIYVTTVIQVVFLLVVAVTYGPLGYANSLGNEKESLTLKERVDVASSFRESLLKMFGGAFLIATITVSYKAYQASRKNVEVSQEKNDAERFFKATEMLGKNDELYIQLGGIYAMSHLGSTNINYTRPSLDVLSTFVQNTSTRNLEKERALREKLDAILEDVPIGEVNIAFLSTQMALEAVSRETQAQTLITALKAVSNLVMATDGRAFGESPFTAKVNNTDLSGLNLPQLMVPRLALQDCYLLGSDFSGSDFQGGTFIDVDFSHCELRLANLSGATLIYSDMEGVDLTGALLFGAKLHRLRNLKQSQINVAVGSRDTLIPSGLTRPLHWDREAPDPLTTYSKFHDYEKRCGGLRELSLIVEASKELFPEGSFWSLLRAEEERRKIANMEESIRTISKFLRPRKAARNTKSTTEK